MDKFFSTLVSFGINPQNIKLVSSSKYKLTFIFIYNERLVEISIIRSLMKDEDIFYFDWKYKKESGRSYSIEELANDIKSV